MYQFAKKVYRFFYYTFWKKKLYQPVLQSLISYYVISFPKCGRTWTEFFVGEYFAQKFDIPRVLESPSIIRRHSDIPRIKFSHGNARPQSVTDLKESRDQFNNERVVFLVRDPRDVVVSYYHQLNKRRPYFSEAEFNDVQAMDLSSFIRHELYGIEWIVTYMNTWYAGRDNFDEFMLLRYEDMQRTPKTTFKNLLRFIGEKGQELDTSALAAAIRNSQFDNMREIEEEEKIDDGRLQPANKEDPDSYKVRKGKVGGFREELNEEDIAYVNEAVKQLHPDLGYNNET